MRRAAAPSARRAREQRRKRSSTRRDQVCGVLGRGGAFEASVRASALLRSLALQVRGALPLGLCRVALAVLLADGLPLGVPVRLGVVLRLQLAQRLVALVRQVPQRVIF